MLGIKLVDVDTSNADLEVTGTCELCFGSAWCDNPILIFENPKGDRVVIYGYYWSCGDYFEIEIGNYLNFSDWLSKQDINWNTLTNDEENYEYLEGLVHWYIMECDKEVEE